MNPDLKTPLNLPEPNWDRILKWSAVAVVAVTGFALLSRARTFIVLAEVVDVLIVLGLLGLAAYAIIARYTK